MDIIPIILSGGSGTRLWPISRTTYPKQFLPLVNSDKTLLQETLSRTHTIATADPYIVCNEDYQFIVSEQMKQIEKHARLILEPIGRNTAPAIALAALDICFHYGDALMIIMPSDHLIDDISNFHSIFDTACMYSTQEFLVSFGVCPTRPETGYGYIEVDGSKPTDQANGLKIKSFHEKPDKETATKYLEAGNYYWNSGIYLFRASTYLRELKQFAPDIFEATTKAMIFSCRENNLIRIKNEIFQECPSVSVDYAIMEHTKNGVVIPVTLKWSDLGCWHSLWEAKAQDSMGNVTQGDVLVQDSTNSYIRSENRLIVALGVHNHIIVETADAVLIANKDSAPLVKNIVEQLKLNQREEANTHRKVYRPWGSYEVLLECSNFKVKHLFIKAGQSLSLQLHRQRSEHWVIVEGLAEVTCGETVAILKKSESLYIPVETKHRLKNIGYTSLEIIEIQTGSYLGEDDIVRFSDQYGRAVQEA